MAHPWTAYNRAHEQPFDVNAAVPCIDDWGLYNAAHADPYAVPIEGIQASPGGVLTATVSAEVATPIATEVDATSVKALPSTEQGTPADDTPPPGNATAEATVAWQGGQPDSTADPLGGINADVLGQYESIAPGLALALVQAEQARAKQSRMYRLLRLVVTMVIAITAIACGQWALVHGADQQALYLSAAGLISLLTTVLQHE